MLVVNKQGEVLVGKRKGSHAAGLYSFPGGHLDFGETWEECVLREFGEECGESARIVFRPHIPNLKPEWFVTNDIMPEYDNHYNTLFFVADYVDGEIINKEPHKCEEWIWVSFDRLVELTQGGQTANWIPVDYLNFYKNEIGLQ